MLQFYLTRHHLGGAGKFIASTGAAGTVQPPPWRRFWTVVGLSAGLLTALVLGWIPVNAVGLAQVAAYGILSMAALYFLYYFTAAGLTREERRRGVVLVVLFVGCALFFSGYEQAGSSMNLFAERYTDRVIGWLNFVIPTGWFQSLNSIFIILFAPFFAWAVGRARPSAISILRRRPNSRSA